MVGGCEDFVCVFRSPSLKLVSPSLAAARWSDLGHIYIVCMRECNAVCLPSRGPALGAHDGPSWGHEMPACSVVCICVVLFCAVEVFHEYCIRGYMRSRGIDSLQDLQCPMKCNTPSAAAEESILEMASQSQESRDADMDDVQFIPDNGQQPSDGPPVETQPYDDVSGIEIDATTVEIK